MLKMVEAVAKQHTTAKDSGMAQVLDQLAHRAFEVARLFAAAS
jgi:hypothetical protein